MTILADHADTGHDDFIPIHDVQPGHTIRLHSGRIITVREIEHWSPGMRRLVPADGSPDLYIEHTALAIPIDLPATRALLTLAAHTAEHDRCPSGDVLRATLQASVRATWPELAAAKADVLAAHLLDQARQRRAAAEHRQCHLAMANASPEDLSRALLSAFGYRGATPPPRQHTNDHTRPARGVKERVAQGAALLDMKVPGWEQRIDLDTLDIPTSTQCVLAQVFSGEEDPYAYGADFLFGLDASQHPEAPDLVEHGFAAPDTLHDADVEASGWADLTAEWKRVIRQRRSGELRPDLEYVPHSITVEAITPALRRDSDLPDEAALVVVERHHGRLAKLCTSSNDLTVAEYVEWGYDVTIEGLARGIAKTYGATYVQTAPVVTR